MKILQYLHQDIKEQESNATSSVFVYTKVKIEDDSSK
jgi:hypothetical protein